MVSSSVYGRIVAVFTSIVHLQHTKNNDTANNLETNNNNLKTNAYLNLNLAVLVPVDNRNGGTYIIWLYNVLSISFLKVMVTIKAVYIIISNFEYFSVCFK